MNRGSDLSETPAYPVKNLNEYLEGMQEALLHTVLPTVQDAHARSQLLAIDRVLTRLIVNASAVPAEFANATQRLGQIVVRENMGSLADPDTASPRAESLSVLADTPEQYFGGLDLHRSAEAILKSFATKSDVGATSCHDLLQWEADCLARLRRNVVAFGGAKDASAHSVSQESIQERLEDYLKQRYPQSPGLNVTELKVLPGGRGKLTALFTLAGSNELPKKLVLRRDHPSHVTGTTVVTEFPVLAAAHAAGVKVPVPYFVEPSTHFLGAAFVVMGFVPGRRAGNPLGPLELPSVALSFARQLARLHRIPFVKIGHLFSESQHMTPQSLLTALEGVQKIWSGSNPPPSLAVNYAFAWLRRNVSFAGGSPVLVHGDASFHNVMSSGPRLCAFLDWEWAHVGSAAEDLGYCRPAVESVIEWRQFIEAYRRAGGPDVDQKEIDFFSIWGRLRITTMIIAARALYLAGPARDLEFAHTAIDELYDWYQTLHVDLERVLANRGTSSPPGRSLV